MAAVDGGQIGDLAAECAFPFPGSAMRTESRLVTAVTAGVATIRRVAWTLFVCAVSLAVTGCNGSGGPEPYASSDVTSVAETTESTPTPEELAAEAALEAVAAMVEVQDAARRDPAGKDWEPEIRQVAADPYAAIAVDSIRTYATGGIRQVGDSVVEGEVTGVDLAAEAGPTVTVVACYDNTGSDVVRADNGESILPPGELTRFVWNLTIVQYASTPGEPWLVAVLEPHPAQPC